MQYALVLLHLPLKQGLKLVLGMTEQVQKITVLLHLPLKQGLKHSTFLSTYCDIVSSFTSSIKTRIETHRL